MTLQNVLYEERRSARDEELILSHLNSLTQLQRLNPQGIGVMFAEALLERYVRKGYVWIPLSEGRFRVFHPFETGFYGRETLISD